MESLLEMLTRQGRQMLPCCIRGQFIHRSCVFCQKGKKASVNLLATGKNYLRNHNRTIHAEEDALMNFLRKHRGTATGGKRCGGGVHLLVIRVDKQGNLAMSKPCMQCVDLMRKFSAGAQKNAIKWVHFSNEKGNVEKVKLTHLTSTHVSCFYRRNDDRRRRHSRQ